MSHAAILTDTAATPTSHRGGMGLLDRRVTPGVLVGLLVALFGVDTLLLWRFLGWLGPANGAIGLAFVLILTVVAARAMRGFGDGPSVRTLVVCAAVSLVLLVLGGEGRLLYANMDWTVRDAVLRDMAINPWPFAYMARGVPELLRAPLGMYLVPALAMKAGGQQAGDLALLAQNLVVLTLILGLSASIFATGRSRLIGLAVFVGFSGLDIVGAGLVAVSRGVAVPSHLEWWANPFQYSAHLTQLFWVPQHALAGWTCAAAFMLWREERMPLCVFLALVPLATLWSPLGTLGALPFAAFAGITSLARRTVRPADVALPALATLLVVPTLLYLSAAGGSVGTNSAPFPPATYAKFVGIEVLPFLFAVATAFAAPRFGRPVLVLVAGTLLLLPLWRIGWSSDLMMRGSINALAILAVMTAHALMTEVRPRQRVVLTLMLVIGAVTGIHEIVRAVRWPASPPPLCTFYGAWGPSAASNKSTYLAPVADVPALIRPTSVAIVPARDPAVCWARAWPRPTGI